MGKFEEKVWVFAAVKGSDGEITWEPGSNNENPSGGKQQHRKGDVRADKPEKSDNRAIGELEENAVLSITSGEVMIFFIIYEIFIKKQII